MDVRLYIETPGESEENVWVLPSPNLNACATRPDDFFLKYILGEFGVTGQC